jgi:hypothetical protein
MAQDDNSATTKTTGLTAYSLCFTGLGLDQLASPTRRKHIKPYSPEMASYQFHETTE